MRNERLFIWGPAILAGGVLFLLDLVDVYPDWLLVSVVVLGVAGLAFLVDQIVCAPSRKYGFIASIMMIALSAATVTQDAELVVDNWAVWPFVAGAIVVGLPLELFAARRRRVGQRIERRIGPSAGAKAA